MPSLHYERMFAIIQFEPNFRKGLDWLSRERWEGIPLKIEFNQNEIERMARDVTEATIPRVQSALDSVYNGRGDKTRSQIASELRSVLSGLKFPTGGTEVETMANLIFEGHPVTARP